MNVDDTDKQKDTSAPSVAPQVTESDLSETTSPPGLRVRNLSDASHASFRTQMSAGTVTQYYPGPASATTKSAQQLLLESLQKHPRSRSLDNAPPSPPVASTANILPTSPIRALQQETEASNVNATPSTNDPHNQTCLNWAKGKCADLSCPNAHFFFPYVVPRAHRGGHKTESCDPRRQNQLACPWPEDVCGFSHVEADAETMSSGTEMENLVEKQNWETGMYLRCTNCDFFVFVKDEFTVDRMVEHCDKCDAPCDERRQ